MLRTALFFLSLSAMLEPASYALPQDGPSERIGDLIRGLSDPDLSKRERAQQAIGEQWEKWTKADLTELEKAGQSSDSEVAARAKGVMEDILRLRSFGVQLPVKLAKSGTLSIHGRTILKSTDDPSAVVEVFKPYSTPPKNPRGKTTFTGLRLFLEAEKDVPFERIYTVLSAAAKTTPLSEIVVMNPSRIEESKPEEGNKLLLFTLQGKDPADQVDWKAKFIKEVNYHYDTQQTKNAEMGELTKTVEALRQKVAQLEQQIKEKY